MSRLAVLAGKDYLPVVVAKEAEKAGKDVIILSLTEEMDSQLPKITEHFYQINVGQLERILEVLRAEQVTEAVMAGKVTKEVLFSNLVLDEKAKALLASLPNRNDDTILLALVQTLMSQNIKVLPQTVYLEHLLPQRGVHSQRQPTQGEWEDIRYGQQMAKSIAGLDIGQTVVVKNQAVLAVEAIEGTDAAILRGGTLGRENSVVVKVSKPKQDIRFDIPTVGLNTLLSMQQGRCSVLAIEAGKTFFLHQEKFIQKADEAGIAIVAF